MNVYQIMFISILVVSTPLIAWDNKDVNQELEISCNADLTSLLNENISKFTVMAVKANSVVVFFDEKFNGNPELICTNCSRRLSYAEFFGVIGAMTLQKVLTSSDKFEVVISFFDSFTKLLEAENLAVIAAFMLESIKKKDDLRSYPCPDCKKSNSWIYAPYESEVNAKIKAQA